ncbi:E3 SUMO-protein ligase RanBP2 [Iris pallida]|uniref:E3 SUMO-protein ligase RanBP2 n=1 Tax=Iris pallida TaxID=29817 RepID=A0AAX6EZU2_IRIPA|nr:E3 SUMO-protein ligase RanBP2 [Iris pallida]
MDPVTARSALLLRRFSRSFSDARLSFLRDELESLRPSSPVTAQEVVEAPGRESRDNQRSRAAAEVEISHPWPEWNELMERVVRRGYMELDALDGPKNANRVRTACLNFARDRSGIIRSAFFFSHSACLL